MKRFLILLTASILLAMSSCGKDNENNNLENWDNSNYSLGGGYWKGWYDNHHLITFQFDRERISGNNYSNTPGKLIYQELYDQDWGISANGSYSISENVITASFSKVNVMTEDYSSGSYHGYTNGVSTTKHFIIEKYTTNELVMTDELGRSLILSHYEFTR